MVPDGWDPYRIMILTLLYGSNPTTFFSIWETISQKGTGEMNVQMYNKRYLVELIPFDETTKGGIFLSQKHLGINNKAKILAVPSDAELPLNVGDIVGIENINLQEVNKFDDKTMMVLERDICFQWKETPNDV